MKNLSKCKNRDFSHDSLESLVKNQLRIISQLLLLKCLSLKTKNRMNKNNNSKRLPMMFQKNLFLIKKKLLLKRTQFLIMSLLLNQMSSDLLFLHIKNKKLSKLPKLLNTIDLHGCLLSIRLGRMPITMA